VARRKKGAEAALEESPTEEAAELQEEAAEESEQRPVISDEEMFQSGRAWYVIHTYSGYEDKARTNLEQRIKSMDAEDLIFHVVVPSVDEIEIRDGARRTVPRKIFPGYVLVQMIEMRQDDPDAGEQDKARSSKAWTVVRNTPGVTGFVGSGASPTALDEPEVRSILKQMRAEEPRIKVGFQLGQSIRVTDGPFVDFVGTVDEINVDKGKVRVLVSFFGRETPVELDFLQVERL
jgi:transcriptional antiterminator NusG